jgi:general secretion pathway protein G
MDPWNNQYVYRQPSTHYGYDYDLYSMGKDGKVGGTELDTDITNWVDENAAVN